MIIVVISLLQGREEWPQPCKSSEGEISRTVNPVGPFTSHNYRIRMVRYYCPLISRSQDPCIYNTEYLQGPVAGPTAPKVNFAASAWSTVQAQVITPDYGVFRFHSATLHFQERAMLDSLEEIIQCRVKVFGGHEKWKNTPKTGTGPSKETPKRDTRPLRKEFQSVSRHTPDYWSIPRWKGETDRPSGNTTDDNQPTCTHHLGMFESMNCSEPIR